MQRETIDAILISILILGIIIGLIGAYFAHKCKAPKLYTAQVFLVGFNFCQLLNKLLP